MPNIPTFVTNAAGGLSVQPLLEGAGAKTRAIQNLAGNIGGVADKYMEKRRQQEQMQDAVDVTNHVTQSRVEAFQDLQQRLSEGDPFDHGVVEKWRQDWSDKMGTFGDGLRTDQGRKQYDIERANMLAGLEMSGIEQQSRMAGQKAVGSIGSQTDVLSNMARTDPSQVGILAAAAERNIDVIHSANPEALPASELPKVKTEARQSVWDSSADGLLAAAEQNPNLAAGDIAALQQHISDPKAGFMENMSPGAYNRVLDRVQRLKETQSGVMAGLIKQQFPLALEQIDNGGDPAAARKLAADYASIARTDSQIVEASQMQRDLEYHSTYGATIRETRQLPDSEIQARIDGAKKAWQETSNDSERNRLKANIEAMYKARYQRDQEFKADPAQFAMANNDAVSARAKAFADNPSAQSFAAYADASAAYQRQIKPGDVPRYMTSGMRDSVASAMQQLRNDPNAIAQAGDKLSYWAGITGDKWVQVAHELRAANALNDDQFVAATLYRKPQAAPLARTLLQASAMSNAERYALHGVGYNQALQQVVPELQSLAQSMGNKGPDAAAIIAANAAAITHVMQVQGPDADPHKLASDFIMDEFDFRGRNGYTTLRIPKIPGIDPDLVQRGSESVLHDLAAASLDVPPSQSGLGPNDQRKVYVDRLQHDAVWYTNKDGSGAVLYDLSGDVPVREIVNGKSVPLERNWKQLSAREENAASQSAELNMQTYMDVVKR